MLFNHKSAGYVAYDFSSFNAVTSAATMAAVPAAGNHAGTPVLQPTVTYLAANSGTGVDPRGEIIRSIYTYESSAYGEADKFKGTAVVIGGKYNGSSTTTYYRINLKTTDDGSTNISSHILRNHRYDVEIQSVDGVGEDTPFEAYMGSTTLVARILPWNEAGIKDVEFEQYTITVNSDSFNFPAAGGTQILTVTTNYPTGWTIVSYSLPVGITAARDGVTDNVIITAGANTGNQRSGVFGIKAGNMTKTITVTQL
jgi:hypothetical protein